ncbi:alpha/beta hydrolase [Pseudidiomarina sp. E22-M8]|uniref:alpha/beta hydrolase n=1 Tax=Pseudidiomarina sp. E22-M8 TaxID=3424768 RepID=UPI00403C305B
MMLDKETAALVATMNAAQSDLHGKEISLQEARLGAREMFLSLAGKAPAEVDVTESEVVYDGGRVPIRSYRPSSAGADVLPAVIFFHGGGWSLGDLDCYDTLMRDLCFRTGLQFISVGYRLAPEHKYPAGLNDCLAVVRWLHKHADQYSVDATRLALMGDSAGGNLAVAVAHHLTDDPIAITALHLIYPVLDVYSPHQHYPSRLKFGDGDLLLSREAIANTAVYYAEEPQQVHNVDVSPMALQDVSHLPPTSVLVAGYDPLHDEGAQFAQRLLQAGRLRHYSCFSSTIHAFFSFGTLPVAHRARQLVAAQLRTDLSEGSSLAVALAR